MLDILEYGIENVDINLKGNLISSKSVQKC